MEEKRTPQEWLESEFKGVTILDPDGWDRSDYKESWSEPITKDEMGRRTMMSTVQIEKDSPFTKGFVEQKTYYKLTLYGQSVIVGLDEIEDMIDSGDEFTIKTIKMTEQQKESLLNPDSMPLP
jgi:hypothetical protein